MQPAGKSAQRRSGRRFVARAQLDDMPAHQTIAAVKIREPGRWPFRNEISAQAGITERAADDLLHFAVMQIYAGSKHLASS
jgi:hypothetical protein